MVVFSFALWASFAVVIHCFPSRTSPRTPLLRRADDDPTDLSWITDWASVGDSFSTGIGAGTKYGGWGDWWCSRYDASFPALINTDPRLGDASGRIFTYWPCSGAKTNNVIDQVNGLGDGSQDLITITSGGNDIDFSGILNECVFQWLSDADPITSLCPGKLDDAQGTIDSDDFRSKLDNLISAAKAKLKPDGHVYYVGYAQFFGADDNQCDDVTWAYWYELGKKEYLTLDKRIKMNELVQNINAAINDAVVRAGSGVTFVDYDKYVVENKGRFCEAGYPEDNPNRYGLLLYEWDTDDSVPETDGAVQQTDHPERTVTPNLLMNGTFKADINDYIRQMHEQNPDWGSGWIAAQGDLPTLDEIKATDNQIARGYSGSWVPDGYGHVFHPRPDGHQLIANAVLYHMSANYAKKLNVDVAQEELTSDTCPAPQPLTSSPAPAPSSSSAPAPSPDPTSPPSPDPDAPPPMPKCHDAFDGHTDTQEDAQHDFAEDVCEKAKDDGVVIKKGDDSTFIHEELYYGPDDNAYTYDVFWEDGCESDVTERSAFNPIGADYNCTSLFVRDYKQCNNDGVGGKSTVGCVSYNFHIGDPFGE